VANLPYSVAVPVLLRIALDRPRLTATPSGGQAACQYPLHA
jgi:16S rRNA A1518/A1519 N6-dimethyltransferase RsmA/KsgA/DIM1 with predicted DNA glycosylase/AP lyase activity